MDQRRTEEGVLKVVAVEMLEGECDGAADIVPAVVDSSAKGGLKADGLGIEIFVNALSNRQCPNI